MQLMTICPTDNDIMLLGHGDLDHARFACDTLNAASGNSNRAYVAIDWDSAWSDDDVFADLDHYDSRKTDAQKFRGRNESFFPIAGSSEIDEFTEIDDFDEEEEFDTEYDNESDDYDDEDDFDDDNDDEDDEDEFDDEEDD